MSETGKVPTSAEMADRLAIQEVIHAWSRGLDRADAELLKSVAWPDSEVDYGGYKGPTHPFCDLLPDALKNYVNTQHQVSKHPHLSEWGQGQGGNLCDGTSPATR